MLVHNRGHSFLEIVMKFGPRLTAFLNRHGLYTKAQVTRMEQSRSVLERQIEPLITYALESPRRDYEVALTWESGHYGGKSHLLMRDLRQIGRAARPDFDLVWKNVPKDSPAYQDWARRQEENGRLVA